MKVKIGANRNRPRFPEANAAELRGLYQRGHFLSRAPAGLCLATRQGQRWRFLGASIVAYNDEIGNLRDEQV